MTQIKSFLKRKDLLLFLIIVAGAFLRFYRIDVNPPGLYWDETAFGYDAYSVLKTSMDQHGRTLPLFFESFGDWKLPGYFYLLIPSIKVFGLTEFAVRFPSALLGTLSIPVFFLLLKKLTSNTNLSLFVALALALSPWHIQFSRAGFESIAGLFFIILGLYLFVSSLEKPRTLLLTFAFLLLTLSMYTYHSYRIFVPLLVLALLIIYRKQILNNLKKFLIPVFISFLIFIPLLQFTFTKEGQSRAASQSPFKKEVLERAKIDYDQKSKQPLRFLSGYLYKEPTYFSYLALNGYIDHFSPLFLFFQGDQIGRHSQVDMGQIYAFDAILLVSAIFAFKTQNKKTKQLMITWLLLAPIPASIVLPTPHAQRALQMAPVLAFFSGLGAYHLYSKKGLIIPKAMLSLLILFYISSYVHLLFNHYPQKFGADWQDGYRSMVKSIQKHQESFKKVYVTNISQVPYIYLLFYQSYNPKSYIDQNGSSESFDKYIFTQDNFDPYNKGRILYVAPSWQKVDGNFIEAVDDSAGRHLYSLWEVGVDD